MMKRNIISRILVAALCAAAAVVSFSACNGIYDDELQPCPQGVALRFIYDYNMEYADAFTKKVDCITLYIYDREGNFIGSRTETGDVLKNASYRMELDDLEEGDYHFVAYGGTACAEASFATVTPPVQGSSLTGLSTVMEYDGETSDTHLHDFFFGSLEVSVAKAVHQEYTLPMMKNTNTIRVILQQLSGQPVSDEDFDFAITDDNTLFAYDNEVMPNGTLTYFPWAKGQETVGGDAQGNGAVAVAYAEFSTSRLVTGNEPRLRVSRRVDDVTVIDIPLIDYLLLMKSDVYTRMGSQEYLDRESEWTLVFFLDAAHEWVKTQIVINDWVVRLNLI